MIRRTGGNRTLVRPAENQSLILGLYGVFATYSCHRRLSHCIAPEKQVLRQVGQVSRFLTGSRLFIPNPIATESITCKPLVGWGFHNSYPSGSTFRYARYTTERIASECAVHSGGIRGDRANAPHRWPVLRPADLPHVTGGKGTYQELSTQRVSVPKVHRILIRQVIVGQFVKLDESGGPIPHRHDTHGT